MIFASICSTSRAAGVFGLFLFGVNLATHPGMAEQRPPRENATIRGGAKPPTDAEHLIAAAQVQSFEDAVAMAEAFSRRPMRPLGDAPSELAELDYEDYMTIRYLPGRAYWQTSSSPFLLETFHQGYVQKDRVDVLVQTPDGNRLIPFDPDRFDYGGVTLPNETLAGVVAAAGHAGVKLIERIDPDDLQELITFLGASYFRARSRDTLYGTSARGLAIDIAMPKDEEFPRFRTFWIRRPFPDDRTLAVTAFLDTPACTGAYHFMMTPGDKTTSVDVRAEVFPRAGQTDRKFAIAPLTSMWMWGDGLRGPSLDERPQVHDSSALVIQDGDNAPIYRPLARISYPSVSRYPVESLRGFALVQRNRDPKSYQDDNASYQRRPTVTVTPHASWDGGVIELFEIPGAHEGVDNIGAYWLPPEVPKFGESLTLAYRIDFTSQDAVWSGDESTLAKITRLNVDRAGEGIQLTVRLSGKSLRKLDAGAVVQQIATVRGEVLDQSIRRTSPTELEASLTIRPTEDAPTEITVAYQIDELPIAETLSYLCPQSEPHFVFPAVYTKVE